MTKIKVLQASSGPRPPSKKTRYKIRKTMEIKNKERQAVENTGERSYFKACSGKEAGQHRALQCVASSAETGWKCIF